MQRHSKYVDINKQLVKKYEKGKNHETRENLIRCSKGSPEKETYSSDVYMKKKSCSQINSLMFHVKELEKKRFRQKMVENRE